MAKPDPPFGNPLPSVRMIRDYEVRGAVVYDVMADVRQGTQRDAILHSVGANAAHGLRRTNDDKSRAVMVLLNDPEWSKWSAREVAKACGVSHDYAARLKREVSSDDSDEPRTYTTKHGTTATMNTANIGAGSNPVQDVTTPSKPDQEPPAADPHRTANASPP